MDLHLLSPADDTRMTRRGRISGAAACSVALHLGVLVLLLWITYAHARDSRTPPPAETARVVWVAMPGPSGGGGGRRTTVPAPPKVTPPQAARTIEPPAVATAPVEIAPETPAEPQPSTEIVADAAASGAAGPATLAAGTGTGDGTGDGNGDGAGPGSDRGFGGGAYLPGNGVTSPVPTRRAPPSYTAEAMRARAQGVITVACVVEPNGECGDVRVLRAFSPPFGLDQQALDAARRWRFRPGMRNGEPVPVLVNLEIEFNIR